MGDKKESFESYRIRRAKEERQRANQHKTSSIMKITGLLREGWVLFKPVQAASGVHCISSHHWQIYEPGKGEGYYIIPASAIEKLCDLDIIKTHNRNAEFLIDDHTLVCSRGCHVNVNHPITKDSQSLCFCPNELSHDIMHGGTKYCRRRLF